MHGHGAFSRAPNMWNATPNNIAEHPERLWDWSYPQFLAGRRIPPSKPEVYIQLHLNNRIAVNSEEAAPYLIAGWSGVEQHFRWSDGDLARIGFHVESTDPLLFKIRLAPFVVKGEHEKQRVTVLLNENELISMVLWEPIQQEMQWVLPAALLRQDNIIDFILKNAESPANLKLSADQRQLGVAAEWFEIEGIK